MSLNVTFRNCVTGEILKDFVCITCSPETYTLDAGGSVCNACITGASCPGGNLLNISAGYWRANTSTDSITECILEAACVGGYEAECETGYNGLLCHNCSGLSSNGTYYARSGDDKCEAC